jgi:hypothetical protein
MIGGFGEQRPRCGFADHVETCWLERRRLVGGWFGLKEVWVKEFTIPYALWLSFYDKSCFVLDLKVRFKHTAINTDLCASVLYYERMDLLL